MITRILFCATLLVSSLAALDVHALEILFPESHVSTVHPRISVVGRTQAATIDLELNGKKVKETQVKDGFFHVRLPLPFGLNRIKVLARTGEMEIEEPVELQVLCGPKIPKSYQKVFSSSVFHTRESQPTCLGCHQPPEINSKGDSESSWCYACHDEIQEQFLKHGADDEEENICNNCHKINFDMSHQTQGVYSDLNPCYHCHTDKIGEFAQDFIHGPVAGGTCTVCHNPHGSQFDYNLKSPLPNLCLYCHSSVEGMDAKNLHEPFSSGKCADCHDPHSTGNRWVLVKKTGELCLGCHAEDVVPENHRHPTGGRKPKSDLVQGLNVDEEGNLECLTCHLPHGSPADFLLRSTESNGCSECHPEY